MGGSLIFRWYSICSAHRDRDRTCSTCDNGHWKFEPLAKFKQWNFRRTHEVVNGQWVKK